MPNSYSKFTFDDIEALGLNIVHQELFETSEEVQPSSFLEMTLKEHLDLPLGTEKAKSELLITPILNELRRINENRFTFFSGYNFDVDKKRGLKGHCDFLMSLSDQRLTIREPVFCIVEAKNENLESGIPQCIAEMYAARLFNERKSNDVNTIHGTVSFGFEWLLLRLHENTVLIDTNRYYLQNLPELLGALQGILDFYASP